MKDTRVWWKSWNTRLMSKIRDNSNHIVVERISNIGMRCMPHCATHCKRGESSFLSTNLFIRNCPVRIITDSCCWSIVGNVWDVVTWLIDYHFVCSKLSGYISLIRSNWASSVINIWSATSPVISVTHIVSICTVCVPVSNHFFPCIILWRNKNIVIVLSHASF